MWATLVFTLIFVGLGLTVLFVAISGGPGGARKRMASQSRGTRRLALVNFVIALLVLGLGIPAAVIATVNNRDDIPEANVKNLTKAELHGRQLFGERCANCHTLEAANAVAQVGPNLDNLQPTKALVLNAIRTAARRATATWRPIWSRARTPRMSRPSSPRPSASRASTQHRAQKVPSVRDVISMCSCRGFPPCYDAARQAAEFPEDPGSGGPRQVGRIALCVASVRREPVS